MTQILSLLLHSATRHRLLTNSISVGTGVITRDARIQSCVQNLNLSSGDGIPTITGDDLWRRRHGPQTLSKALDFIGRVVKDQVEGKTSLETTVQQTLIEFTKPSVLDGGIAEYDFSHPVLTDTEEEKSNSNIGDQNQNPIPWPRVVVEANSGAPPNALEK